MQPPSLPCIILPLFRRGYPNLLPAIADFNLSLEAGDLGIELVLQGVNGG